MLRLHIASRIFAFVARTLWHMALNVLWRQYSLTTAPAERLLDVLVLEYRHIVTFLCKLSVPSNRVLDFLLLEFAVFISTG